MAALRPLIAVLAIGMAAALAGCGSEVGTEPDMVGVTTVRILRELPDAGLDEPEVSGSRTLRFHYTTETCGAHDADALPAHVRATYTIDTVIVRVTPAELDCPSDEREPVTRGMEVFLSEPVDGRTVTGQEVEP